MSNTAKRNFFFALADVCLVGLAFFVFDLLYALGAGGTASLTLRGLRMQKELGYPPYETLRALAGERKRGSDGPGANSAACLRYCAFMLNPKVRRGGRAITLSALSWLVFASGGGTLAATLSVAALLYGVFAVILGGMDSM